MGFPVGYTGLFIPKFLLHFLSLMSFLRNFILNLFGPEPSIQANPTGPKRDSLAAVFIRELVPVVKYSELIEAPERCAVCLYEFNGDDEISRLSNCRHIFHRCCLDGWLDHDQKTCPLCRTSFVPEDMQEAFNQRIWLASGISDY